MSNTVRINFNQPLHTVYGEVMENDGIPITLGTICVNALLAPEKDLKADEALKRHTLAQKIAGKVEKTEEGIDAPSHNEIEVSVKQRALLQDLIAKNYAPSIHGAAHHLLEG